MKEELLDGAAAYVVEHGIAGLSLRPLAKALGTSDRMLVYYFGSKEQLVAEVVETLAGHIALELGTRLAARRIRTPLGLVRSAWEVMTDPALRPAVALLFEVDSLALRHGSPYRETAAALSGLWHEAIRSGLVQVGVDEREATREAPLIAAALLGNVLWALLIDSTTPPVPLAALVRGLGTQD